MYFFDLPQRSEAISTVKLTIQKAHPGSKYSDTAVTELVLVTPLEKAPKINPAR